MFRIPVILALCSLSLGLGAQIEFIKTGTWQAAVEEAKKQNKAIFVDVYAEWCGPCKWMSKNSFQDKQVGEFFNANFVSVKIEGDKGEGIEFSQKYKVSGFPTLFFFAADGELLHKAVGMRDAEGLLAEAQKANDPEKQISTLNRKYEAGERSSEFLKTYLTSLMAAGEEEKTTEVFDFYFKSLSQEQRLDPENLMLFIQSISQLDSPWFAWFLEHEKDIAPKMPDNLAKQYRDFVLHNEIERIIDEIDSPKELKAQEKQLKKKLGKTYSKAAIADLRHHYYMGDEKKSLKYSKAFLDKLCDNPMKLNEVAWTYFEVYDSKKHLEAALHWVNRSIAMEASSFNMDTKAHILYKLGKYAEAKETAEKTLALLQSPQEIDVIKPGIDKLLEQIETKL